MIKADPKLLEFMINNFETLEKLISRDYRIIINLDYIDDILNR